MSPQINEFEMLNIHEDVLVLGGGALGRRSIHERILSRVSFSYKRDSMVIPGPFSLPCDVTAGKFHHMKEERGFHQTLNLQHLDLDFPSPRSVSNKYALHAEQLCFPIQTHKDPQLA